MTSGRIVVAAGQPIRLERYLISGCLASGIRGIVGSFIDKVHLAEAGEQHPAGAVTSKRCYRTAGGCIPTLNGGPPTMSYR
ncbi:hypothetical protein [Mycobacterium lepromatosis]|uniref:hypothetical protein n=1 Tax=Mycobacterium lepromatosis TaxID=480418 RepID=UPI000A88088F|nr:hypothetical protein [Mycobacterium lepromatosis]